MSPLTKPKQVKEPKRYGSIILIGYVIISALFIGYVAYSYFGTVVYQSGIQSGQEQGYEAAIAQLIDQAGTKCEPVSINLGEDKIDIINVECLKQAPVVEETMQKAPEQGQ